MNLKKIATEKVVWDALYLRNVCLSEGAEFCKSGRIISADIIRFLDELLQKMLR